MDSTQNQASPRLDTERLVLRLGGEGDVPEIVRYFRDNREFLRPFDPARPASFYEEPFWRAQVRQSLVDHRLDRAVRFFLFLREEERIVGTANFTQILRGVSHTCTLGYGLDAGYQGRGMMREALEAALPYMLTERGLHRIEANYMPHNVRSGRLLRRLGFTVHGYARDYLLIAGEWQDHVLTSLLNPEWRAPGAG